MLAIHLFPIIMLSLQCGYCVLCCTGAFKLHMIPFVDPQIISCATGLLFRNSFPMSMSAIVLSSSCFKTCMAKVVFPPRGIPSKEFTHTYIHKVYNSSNSLFSVRYFFIVALQQEVTTAIDMP